jgi:pimeloyl-ACP methyl ester carboxylesterase
MLIRLLTILALAGSVAAQQPGVLTDAVVPAKNAQQSYALYLPSKYTRDRQWPVLFVFDPDAQGKQAAEVFRDAAEKYGYIIAASNNSKNGPRRGQGDAALTMMADVQQRFSLDGKRMYTAGFSGGARVAGMVGLLCHGCVRAVIACGAGFPELLPEDKKKELPAYFFTVGQYDFNYFDVLDSARALQTPAVVAVFDGVHQWPPPDVVMRAVAWTAAGASERDIMPVTPAETAQRKRQQDLVRPVISALDRVMHPQAARPAEQLGGNDDVSDPDQDIQDARREMAALRKKRMEATGADLIPLRRALAEVYAYAYETGEQLESEGKPRVAAAFYHVATAAIAPNPYLTYHLAAAWAAAGEKKKALATLKQAVALGFHDTETLAHDPHFDALRTSSELRAIVETMH